MIITELFKVQATTDGAVASKLDNSLEDWKSLQDRNFAFRVEVMELANEIGFFKYWKHSHSSSKERILDEMADCIAFALSIGLTHGYSGLIKEVEPFAMWDDYYMEDLFDMLTDIKISNMGKFQLAFSLLLGIGIKIGATEVEIEAAYRNKSEENIKRQEGGY